MSVEQNPHHHEHHPHHDHHDHHAHDHHPSQRQGGLMRLSRRMLLFSGGAFATLFLGRRQVAIAQDHPLWNSQVQIFTQGNYRYIRANGIPNHTTGNFPNRGNPNTIAPQSYQFRVPANPAVAERLTVLHRQPFGVALNGVTFDPGTAGYWNQDINSGWHYEAINGRNNLGLDGNNAHVQPNGAYHYHGLPVGLIATLDNDQRNGQRVLLIGYAADGFPVYAQYGYAEAHNARSTIQKLQSSYRLK